MKGYRRISRKDFYARGGFSNGRLVRKGSGDRWLYYERID